MHAITLFHPNWNQRHSKIAVIIYKKDIKTAIRQLSKKIEEHNQEEKKLYVVSFEYEV